MKLGAYILVDEVDKEILGKHHWKIFKNGYVAFKIGKNSCKYLHRLLLNARNGEIVDHINGNKLDNRRENLRICTQSQNLQNRGKNKNNTSGFKGVYFNKKRNNYESFIWKDNKKYFIGNFKNILDAAKAYNARALELHGEYAYLNKI